MQLLETARLLLSPETEPLPPPMLETLHRLYVDELEGDEFTIEALEQEVLFDVHLARNHLGRHFGRPAVYLKSNGSRIGHCVFLPRLCTPTELFPIRAPSESPHQSSIEVEIGWAIAKSYRNQGYATEAARALIHYGIAELGLARVVAFTEASNAASLKVMQHVGMRIGRNLDSNDVVGVIDRLPT
jgi:RimJ/RimL family protein N-acetyltransferase